MLSYSNSINSIYFFDKTNVYIAIKSIFYIHYIINLGLHDFLQPFCNQLFTNRYPNNKAKLISTILKTNHSFSASIVNNQPFFIITELSN